MNEPELLHRRGYDVGLYVIIERLTEDGNAPHYDSLARSDAGWRTGQHDHLPFIEYLLRIVLAAHTSLKAA